ncbi:MAG TPA: methyltransferase domain-containing protein [Thermodesulfobacteriota bacterium]|nr:methyltransferase domain-containing protein [Thermodesulfobacteriota bacterium]
MRQSVKDYLVKIVNRFPIMEPIYEIGSFRVEGQEEFADLRPFFPGKAYIGCDMRSGLGVDRIEDVHCLNIKSNSIGTVLVFDTLEHVENVYQAMEEIYRILKPGGMVIMSSVMNFPLHDYPSDYWRFTPKAFDLLLKRFAIHEVEFDGDPSFPEGIYGFGIKGDIKRGITTSLQQLIKFLFTPQRIKIFIFPGLFFIDGIQRNPFP